MQQVPLIIKAISKQMKVTRKTFIFSSENGIQIMFYLLDKNLKTWQGVIALSTELVWVICDWLSWHFSQQVSGILFCLKYDLSH